MNDFRYDLEKERDRCNKFSFRGALIAVFFLAVGFIGNSTNFELVGIIGAILATVWTYYWWGKFLGIKRAIKIIVGSL